MLESILNDLFHVFRYETCSNLRQVNRVALDSPCFLKSFFYPISVTHTLNEGPPYPPINFMQNKSEQALDILLLAMERHNHEKHIQVSRDTILIFCVCVFIFPYLCLCIYIWATSQESYSYTQFHSWL